MKKPRFTHKSPDDWPVPIHVWPTAVCTAFGESQQSARGHGKKLWNAEAVVSARIAHHTLTVHECRIEVNSKINS